MNTMNKTKMSQNDRLIFQFQCNYRPIDWRQMNGFIKNQSFNHYNDVIMDTIASEITSVTIVYSTVYSAPRSKKTSKLRVTSLCAGNSPGTGEFPTQTASNAENVSIWWRHHARRFFSRWYFIGKHWNDLSLDYNCMGQAWIRVYFKELNVLRTNHFGSTKSISGLLMPWLPTSPGHQYPWYLLTM